MDINLAALMFPALFLLIFLGIPVSFSLFAVAIGFGYFAFGTRIGLQSFLLGFPSHFEWAWRTLFNKGWGDVVFASTGGSAEFRKPRFAMWIGYDF